jgi:hypothetical protein
LERHRKTIRGGYTDGRSAPNPELADGTKYILHGALSLDHHFVWKQALIEQAQRVVLP